MANEPAESSASDAEVVAAEAVTAEVVAPTRATAEPSPNQRLAASRWQVLVLLFLAAGPLALPVLFQSPRFSRFWKFVLFLLVILQTILVVLIVILFSRWLLVRIEQLRALN
jgi:hypothetical protein